MGRLLHPFEHHQCCRPSGSGATPVGAAPDLAGTDRRVGRDRSGAVAITKSRGFFRICRLKHYRAVPPIQFWNIQSGTQHGLAGKRAVLSARCGQTWAARRPTASGADRHYVREVLALGEVDALLAESAQVKKVRYRSRHSGNGDAGWNAAGRCVRRTGRLPELCRNLTEHALGLARG